MECGLLMRIRNLGSEGPRLWPTPAYTSLRSTSSTKLIILGDYGNRQYLLKFMYSLISVLASCLWAWGTATNLLYRGRCITRLTYVALLLLFKELLCVFSVFGDSGFGDSGRIREMNLSVLKQAEPEKSERPWFSVFWNISDEVRTCDIRIESRN